GSERLSGTNKFPEGITRLLSQYKTWHQQTPAETPPGDPKILHHRCFTRESSKEKTRLLKTLSFQ
ncbi:MAG: hypothetical protein KDA70_16595, partial [Planctomycetaceae bacterium]|nr:hypothetical protein [Planctomycetaceae bacterium]